MKTYIILALLLLIPSLVNAENAKINDLHVIELKNGANPVSHFAPDGSDGLIVRAFRGNGNAHSYNIYMAMVHPEGNRDTWMVADTQLPLKDNPLHLDTLRDDPLSGENYAHSVWFAKGKLDNVNSTFLLNAQRDISHGLYDETPVDIQIFVLKDANDTVGITPFYFEQIEERISTKKYQSSECDLANELNLTPPRDVETDCHTDGKQ